jgi:sialidase-1
MPSLKNLRHVLIYSDPQNFCAEVAVVSLPNGELVAVFARNRGLQHTDTGDILLARSRDNGRTWDPDPVVVFPAAEDYGYALAGLSLLSDGRLVANAYGYEFLVDGRIDFQAGSSCFQNVFLAWSGDGGHTWSERQKANIAPMRAAGVRDGIAELPDGTLLLPLCGLQERRGNPELAELESWTAFVLGSMDGGKHWIYWGTMGHDPVGVRSYWEPGLVRLPDGRLLGMLRTLQWPNQDPPGGYLYMTISEDEGASWSNPRKTGLWGYPADLITLRDGRVLCTYGRRREPMGIRICVSEDGATWDPANEIVIREYDVSTVAQGDQKRGSEERVLAKRPESLPYRHIGYPTSVQLDNGEILSAYHLFDAQGKQYIECAIYQLA